MARWRVQVEVHGPSATPEERFREAWDRLFQELQPHPAVVDGSLGALSQDPTRYGAELEVEATTHEEAVEAAEKVMYDAADAANVHGPWRVHVTNADTL
jgi:hypothetical protein